MSTTFMDRMTELIKLAGNASKLADKAGISRTAIEKWRMGMSEPTRDRILALVEATGVSLTWLVAGVGEMFSEEGITTAAAVGMVDTKLLAECLILVEDWLTENRREMPPHKRSEVVAEIYALAIEGEAKKAPINKERVGRILRLAS